jgi:AraC family transcriptional regulator
MSRSVPSSPLSRSPSDPADRGADFVAVSRLLRKAQDVVVLDTAAALRCLERAVCLLGKTEIVEPGTMRGGLAGWQMTKVQTYIDSHIDEPIRVGELTSIAKLSIGHFSKAFKKSFGMSPHNYVVERRLQHAERLLATGSLPICAIAVDCGFCDQAHFSRQFRRATGLTPAAWRRLHAADRPHARPPNLVRSRLDDARGWKPLQAFEKVAG